MMTIEEKAKAYDVAAEEIGKLLDVLLENGLTRRDGILYDNFIRIFPQLKQIEDEWVSKEIIGFINESYRKKFISSRQYDLWLSWLKKKSEQKQEWSEEDEKTIRLLIAIVENNHNDDAMFRATEISPTKYLTRNEVIERIKRLRPQSHWKPSEEQMEALRIARDRNDRTGSILSQLYDDLKKVEVIWNYASIAWYAQSLVATIAMTMLQIKVLTSLN